MTNQELQNFIDKYSTSDFEKIQLKWNGKYGQEFIDENYEFRIKVCEFIIPQIDKPNILLIRDLYCEIGKISKMTFGVYLNFHLFADELLKRGGKTFLLDYIRGASHTMDTGLSSGRLTISNLQAKDLLEYFDQLKATTQDKDELRLLNDYIRHRLYHYANK